MVRYKKIAKPGCGYKFKLLLAILTIAFMAISLNGCGGEKTDVEIAYVTDGRTISPEAEMYMNECFAPKIKDVNGDKIKNVAFSPLYGIRADMEFVAEGSQIVLMDGNTLRKFIKTGVLEPLDAYAQKIKLDLDKHPDVSSKTDLLDEVHTYAIPMEYISLLLEIGFPAENYYLTVRATSSDSKTVMEKKNNAFGIMDILLDQKVG